jgi:protein-L-isoaspartate(D-aspartate) O-methyltransferase
MKPMKAIGIFFLILAGAAIAGILVGISVQHANPPVVYDATDVTDPALVYHEVSSPGPAAGRPPPETSARRPLAPPRPRPSPPEVIGSQSLPVVNQIPMLRRVGREDRFAAARERMVQEQLIVRGLTDPAVLQAMRTVHRQDFTPGQLVADAYVDRTLDCGSGRIMETPFVIATAAAQLAAQPQERVLEVEAAPGYATAVYSTLAKEVYATQSIYASTLEVDLRTHGFTNNVFVRQADVGRGWPEEAPFDTIIFNRPLDQVAEPLLAQLKPGGRLILPVTDDGKLYVLKKFGQRLVLQTQIFVRPPPVPDNQVSLPPVHPVRLSPR